MANITIHSTVIEQAMICDNHEEPVVEVVNEATADCSKCGRAMVNVGWFESVAMPENDCG